MIKNDVSRKKRIEDELANLPFSSRPTRRRKENNSCKSRDLSAHNKYKKKLPSNDCQVRPFSLSHTEDETLEAIARFRKAKRPNQDISLSSKMYFVQEIRKTDFEMEMEKKKKKNAWKGHYPSFWKPLHEQVREMNEKMFPVTQREVTPEEKNAMFETMKIEEMIEEMKNQKTPNIHTTRRLRSYFQAKGDDLPEILQRIDPIPLRYDKAKKLPSY